MTVQFDPPVASSALSKLGEQSGTGTTSVETLTFNAVQDVLVRIEAERSSGLQVNPAIRVNTISDSSYYGVYTDGTQFTGATELELEPTNTNQVGGWLWIHTNLGNPVVGTLLGGPFGSDAHVLATGAVESSVSSITGIGILDTQSNGIDYTLTVHELVYP